MRIIESAAAGDVDATAEVLREAESLIREYADSEEERQSARVALWASLPGFQGDDWTAYARSVLETR
ncbi:hypothetical protein [Streptomyces thermodiastaticus]|uniref:hypothetical protein n=1 Tax=Streptomyces thermodiastaticus TaxID=44061 RepID=UPI001679764B|nr:hypothetical protein [Streptomyces thermodiastaticus]MCE7552780.1 helix-turn-helix domain-containing protein [Streptomyces thermodiastaticus]GHF88950.1 hypothetical protein GCM10018787_42020 [Streptomyces thermodiastaticus]